MFVGDGDFDNSYRPSVRKRRKPRVRKRPKPRPAPAPRRLTKIVYGTTSRRPVFYATAQKNVTRISPESRRLLAKITAERPPEELVLYFKDSEQAVRSKAARAMLAHGAAAVPVLLEAAQAERPRARYTALWTLDQLGVQSDEVVRLVLPLMEDEEADTRLVAASLAAAGGKQVLPAFQAHLQSDRHGVRAAAARGLGHLGDDALPAVEQLVAHLQDPHAEVRREAAWALGQIGPAAATQTAGPLVELLGDLDEDVREEAQQALINLDEAALGPLVAALSQPRQSVRDAASGAIMQAGSLAAEPLLEALEHAQGPTRYWIVHLLGEIGPQARDAVPALEAMLAQSSDRDLRYYAQQALREISR